MAASSSLQSMDNLSDLITFNHDNSLADLIEEKAFFFRQFFGSKFDKRQVKALISRIKGWNEILDDKLWEAQSNAEKMARLKHIARKIYDSSVTVIIRTKLKDADIENTSMTKALKRMETLLIRIHSVMDPSDSVHEAVHGDYPLSGRAILHKSNSESDLSKYFSQEFHRFSSSERRHAGNLQKKMELELLKREFAMVNKNYIQDWQSILIKNFTKLSTVDEVIAMAEGQTPLQCLVILKNAFTQTPNIWKLPYFIFSIDFEVLDRVLLSLDERDIHFLNRSLRKLHGKAKTWMNDTFNIIRQKFIDLCNEEKKAIDDLARRIRGYSQPNDLQKSHLRDIDNLRCEILYRRQAVNKMRVLIHHVFYNPETTHVLCAVQNEYEKFCPRLSSDSEAIRNCDDNIYGTIHRNIFENNFLDNDDDAIEIFGAWAIIRVEDYREIGLLFNLDEEDYTKIKREDSNALFRVAHSNLVKLGIAHIEDWKRLQIYNKEMLVEYLAKILQQFPVKF